MHLDKATKTVWQRFKTILTSLSATFPYLLGLSAQHKGMTEEYPDRVSARMPEDLPSRFRGFIHNDIKACTGCGDCAKVCPVNCIRVETESGPEKDVKWVAVFDVDMARCMYCGLCVEVCPTNSLTHTRKYEGSVYELNDLVYSYGRGWATKDMQSRWQLQQAHKEAQSEERMRLQQSPVGAELLKLLKEKNKP